MAKRPTTSTLTNTASPTYLTQLNQNFTNVRNQFDNTLSLDGSTPNAMNADIDLNGNDLINANSVNTATLKIGGQAVVPSTAVNQTVKKEFETVAELLASTLTYTFFAVDDYVRVVDGGFVYRVAASGASDQHATTAGGVKLYVLPGEKGYNVKAFGAKGDGVTNDSPVIQKAVDVWIYGNVPASLHFPDGDYACSAQILAVPPLNISAVKSITGGSARFINNSGSQLFKFSVLGTGRVWQRLSVSDLTVSGGLGGFIFEGGDETDVEFLWLVRADRLIAKEFTGDGFILRSGFFESQFYSCEARAAVSNTTGVGFLLRDENNGVVSSIDFYGCTTRYGKNGLRTISPSGADTKIFGGSFFVAWEEGIYLELTQGGGVYGAHVEDNWVSATGSIRAGIRAVGRGSVFSSVYGVARNAAEQNYTLRLFSGAGAPNIILGGESTGTQFKFGHYQTETGGSVVSYGVTYDSVFPAFITSLGSVENRIPAASLGEAFFAYAASVTPDLRAGSFVSVSTLTGNITINNPTTNGTPAVGTMLEVTLVQDATGGRTVTWGSEFKVQTAIDTAAFKRTTWSFRRVNNTWSQVAASSTF